MRCTVLLLCTTLVESIELVTVYKFNISLLEKALSHRCRGLETPIVKEDFVEALSETMETQIIREDFNRNLIEGFMEALIKGFMVVLHLVLTYISQEFVGDNRF